ncbi:MAG: alpha/beta hydrolase [Christensenellales bacterium]
MALIKINMNSAVHNMGTSVYVILPQRGAPENRGGTEKPGPWKTLYLLHGQGGDCSEWVRNVPLERYAARHSLAIVMPSGDNSFYSDLQNGMKYQRFLTEELIGVCESWFPLSREPKDRFIGGFSMGGYGALRTAMGAPGLYGKAVGISSLIDIYTKYRQKGFEDRARMVFGELEQVEENGAELFSAAERMAGEGVCPQFYLTCGDNDTRFSQSERLHQKLRSLGVSVEFHPAQGDHDYAFADRAIQKALDWLVEEREGA